MIKNFLVLITFTILFIYGCTKNENAGIEPLSNAGSTGTGSYSGTAMKGTEGGYSESIPVDTANRMIQSYLYSIGYPANDSGLRSLSFNADSLRSYLQNDNIKNVKFMFAHQPSYMNSGHFGDPSGMNPAALTIIIVGTGASGNSILNTQHGVFEHCAPCPFVCDNLTSPYIQ